MSQDVRTFLKRTAVFLIPFALYAVVVAATDPYELFGQNGLIPHEDKLAVSDKLNYALWGILAYEQNPSKHLMLGDSRVAALSAKTVADATGEPAANLSYGGGSLREAIDTFWLIVDDYEIERVSFGIGFSLYNAANDKNRVAEVRAIRDNPFLYFTNLNVIESMGRLIRARVMGSTPVIGKPPMDPDAFWKHQIDTATRIYYDSWRDPSAYREDLAAIAAHCADNGIRLEFFIPPGHVDLQATVARYGLEEEYARFKTDLAALGVVYDFDYDNEFTEDRGNYRDPYHLTDEAELQVIEGVWGAGSPYVRILGEHPAPKSTNGV